MAKNTIRLRASNKDGTATVKALITHPMETGLRKDKASGQLIPAHFIQNIKTEYNGEVILNNKCGVAVSKNPFISFRIKGGESGDTISVSWVDNQGNTDSNESGID